MKSNIDQSYAQLTEILEKFVVLDKDMIEKIVADANYILNRQYGAGDEDKMNEMKITMSAIVF